MSQEQSPPPPQPQQSWDANQSTQPPQQPMAPTPPPAAPPMVESHLPAPATIEQVKIDPEYSPIPGYAYDEMRPYDVIHNPGGVEIRPAHLSGWARTRNDSCPYALAYDPTQYILFHVRWPDGVVEEKIEEWTADMQYLKHEIDAELRGRAARPDGKILMSTHKVINMDTAAKPVEQVKPNLDDHLNQDAVDPVVLDGVFTTSTDLETEYEVRRQLIAQLELPEDTTDLPAHEYQSMVVYPLELHQEGRDRLVALTEADSLVNLALGLQEALNDGVLPARYFRFLDQRLTTAMNRVLRENLTLGDSLFIDSYVEDIADLIAALVEEEGPEIQQVINGQTAWFLKRWFSFREEVYEDEGEAQLCLVDEYINMQLSWTREDIVSLNLSHEPVLLRSATHPRVTQVVKDIIQRHRKAETLSGRQVRLITADGTYIQIIPGWLIENSVLLREGA